MVDGEGSFPPGGLIRDACSGSSPVFGHISVGVGLSPPRLLCVRGVVRGGEVVAIEGNVSGIAVISVVGRQLSSDCDVQQLDGCGLRQQAGWDGLRLHLLTDQSTSQVDGES